eukprot:11175967-Lingulodinium_polyedra.AAC.1
MLGARAWAAGFALCRARKSFEDEHSCTRERQALLRRVCPVGAGVLIPVFLMFGTQKPRGATRVLNIAHVCNSCVYAVVV